MSCSPFDLKDYFLRELPDPQQRQVDAHVKVCQPCREELDRLRVTEAALLCLGEEEIPQRIAFVSDKIFEPSPWRRWWAAFWGSTARLGFASAAMLSAAIVVYALHPVAQIASLPLPVQPAAVQVVQPISDAEIQSRIDAAVIKAVSHVENHQSEKTQHLVAELESMRQRMIVASSVWEQDEKRFRARLVQSANWGGPNEQEVK